MEKTILAIISPNKNAVTETFIHAHRNHLNASIRYYYEGRTPQYLEGHGPLRTPSLHYNLSLRFYKKMFLPDFDFDQIVFLRSLQKQKVQVVLAEYGTTGATILPICQKLNIPLLVHFYGFDATKSSLLDTFREPYQALFDYASYILPVAQDMGDRLLQMGCPQEKLIVNPCGPTDPAFYDVPQAPLDCHRFFAMGRFVEKKSPHSTLLAFRQVLVRYPDAQLTMAGDGPLRPVCKDLINHFGMQKNVHMPGIITPEQACLEYARSAAFVQHSVTSEDGNMEGTPAVIVEASAAALPVIATRHGGIPDIVVDNDTGFLVEEHDVAAMAARMCQILDDPPHARTMGQAGRRRVREHLSLERHLETLNRLIHQLAKTTR